MELKFVNRGRTRMLMIDDARITWKNFSGENDLNGKGERSFGLIIPDRIFDYDEDGRPITLAEALQNDVNEYGVGWNVKIKAPRKEGDTPYMVLPVKVKYKNGRGPEAILKSDGRAIELTEETIHRLDRVNYRRIDMDIRAYDGRFRDVGDPYRSAYLDAIWVEHDVSRFAARLAEEEYPGEEPFED